MTVEEVRRDGVDRCLGLCPECAREPQEGSEGGGVYGEWNPEAREPLCGLRVEMEILDWEGEGVQGMSEMLRG